MENSILTNILVEIYTTMKRICTLVLLLFLHLHTLGQNTITYDKEKLLEYYQSQRYADAATYLQSIYPDDTQDIKILNQIAYCFMMAGKLPEAEKNYQKIITQQPQSIPVLFSLANINVRRGQDLKAKGYYEQIIKLDSTNFNGYKQLAALYADDTTSVKIAYLTKANLLNPVEADVAYDLAIGYKKLKKYELGYDILTKAIAADTGNLVLQEARLPIAVQLKKYKEVIATGEKLLTAGADGNVIKDVGMAYYYLKNYEKAIGYFKMLEDLAAENETTLYYTSLSYRGLNQYKLATTYAKKTIQEGISPYTPSYYLLLGGIYEIDNQYTSAASAYKKGLTFGINSSLYYRLGLVYDLKLNQKKTALTNYNLYLKSKPDMKVENEQIAYAKERITALTSAKVPQK